MSALFDKGREGIGAAEIDLDNGDIRVALVSAAYTPNLATHKFLSSLGAAIVARSASLTGKTITDGIFDAADPTVTVPVSSATVTQLVIFLHTGVDATARLIGLVDSGTGLPFVPPPAGVDVVVTFSNGPNKILKI